MHLRFKCSLSNTSFTQLGFRRQLTVPSWTKETQRENLKMNFKNAEISFTDFYT